MVFSISLTVYSWSAVVLNFKISEGRFSYVVSHLIFSVEVSDMESPYLVLVSAYILIHTSINILRFL